MSRSPESPDNCCDDTSCGSQASPSQKVNPMGLYVTLKEDYPMTHKLFADDKPCLTSREAFSRELKARAGQLALEPSREGDYHGLLSEIAGMGEHESVLCMIDNHPHFHQNPGFRELLVEGAAAMVCRQTDRAELCLKKAHHQMPSEPSPMVNLVKIFLDDSRFEEAEEWLDAGLNVHPNESQFWHLYADLIAEKNLGMDKVFESVMAKANSHDSWLGESLAWDCQLELIDSGVNGADSSPDEQKLMSAKTAVYKHKAQSLEAFYHKGTRDLDFLVEYSGALGACGEYAKIPPLVWQARHSTHSLPWKLELHGVQATLAMGQAQKGFELLKDLLSNSSHHLPSHHRSALQDLQRELASEIASSTD